MKQKILCLLIAAFAVLVPAVNAQAGDINANEQGVISAVSQSFSYNGGVYVVKDTYIAQGRAKLAEDGVNLSASEAASYISQFHGSYQELVEDGYCVQISAPSNDPDDVEPTHSKEETKVNRTVLKAILGSTSKNKNKKTKATSETFGGEDLGDDEEDDSSLTEATPTPVPVVNDEWSKEEDLGVTMTFGEEDRKNAQDHKVKISAGSADYTVASEKKTSSATGSDDEDSEGEDKESGSASSTVSSQKNIVSDILHLQIWKIVYFVLLGYTIVALIAAAYYILKVKRHKRKRRRVRKWIAVLLGISFGGWTLLLLIVLGCYFGVYSTSVIQRQMMESDYFLGVTQMTRELAQDELAEAGYSRDIATEVFSLSSVYIEEKQYIRNLLDGKEDVEISTEGIDDTLETEVVKADGTKDEEMIQKLEQIYIDMLQFEIGTVLHDSRVEFMNLFYLIGISAIAFIIILFFVMYGIYDYLHKSARVSAIALLVSSILVTGVAILARVLKVSDLVTANPVYFQEFLQNYIVWDINVFIYMGCIGILAAVGLFIWKNYLHMIYVE